MFSKQLSHSNLIKQIYFSNKQSGSNFFLFRLWLIEILGVQDRISIKKKILLAAFIFFLSFTIKSLHMIDLAPIMHTEEQLHLGMAGEYYRDAKFLIKGEGILIPDNWNPSDTSLLVHAPGYGIFLGSVYKLFGGSYFTIQLVQNILNSISTVLIFFIATSIISWRVGVVTGLLCAVSHHFSYYSNVILPDSICALPILMTMYLLVNSRVGKVRSVLIYVIAGFLIGLSIWLRPNASLMGIMLAGLLLFNSVRRRKEVKRVWILVIVPFLVILPITVRNYLIYNEFVPISANNGIVLWEGIADGGGERFGAVTNDVLVAQQEAVFYDNPIYANAWTTPDGIKRDRDRVKRSLGVIVRNPFWFLGTMVKRMGDMLKYSAGAPLILKSSDTKLIELGASLQDKKPGHPMPKWKDIDSDQSLTKVGAIFSWLRPISRVVQRIAKETAQLFLFWGAILVLILSARRFLWVMMIPLYYLLIQSTMHTEFRYTLPIHYFMFIFAATAWVVLGMTIYKIIRRLSLKQSRS